MSSKKLFLANAELVKYWVSIARDARFELVAIHARSVLMEQSPPQEFARGAEAMLQILSSLADNEDLSVELPSPGIHHSIEQPPPSPVKPSP